MTTDELSFAGKGMAPTLPVLSGGSFCLAADITKRHGLRSGAGPFDWLFCSVRDLIEILNDDFAQFLQPEHYRSITAQTGRPSCLHGLYGGNIDRPLFNHKDPTTRGDHAYYARAVDHFRMLAASGAILFVVEESGEIEELFGTLILAADTGFPGLSVRALRHRNSAGPTAVLTRLRLTGRHELWRIDGSPVCGGVALERAQDETLIVNGLLRAR